MDTKPLVSCINLLAKKFKKSNILDNYLDKGMITSPTQNEAYVLLAYLLQACGKTFPWEVKFFDPLLIHKNLNTEQRRRIEIFKNDIINAIKDLSKDRRAHIPIIRKSDLTSPKGPNFMNVCLSLASFAMSTQLEKNGVLFWPNYSMGRENVNIEKLTESSFELMNEKRKAVEDALLKKQQLKESFEKELEILEMMKIEMEKKELDEIEKCPEEFKKELLSSKFRSEGVSEFCRIIDGLSKKNSDKLLLLQKVQEQFEQRCLKALSFERYTDEQTEETTNGETKITDVNKLDQKISNGMTEAQEPSEEELLIFKSHLILKIMKLKDSIIYRKFSRDINERDAKVWLEATFPPLPYYDFGFKRIDESSKIFHDPQIDWERIDRIINSLGSNVENTEVIKSLHKLPSDEKEKTTERQLIPKIVLNSTFNSSIPGGEGDTLIITNDLSPIPSHPSVKELSVSDSILGKEGSFSLITEDELNFQYLNSIMNTDEVEDEHHGTFDSTPNSELILSIEEPVSINTDSS